MGGYGVDQYLRAFSSNVSAAVVDAPAGYITDVTARDIIKNKVAFWSFHAMDDNRVNPVTSTKVSFQNFSEYLKGATPFVFPPMNVNVPAYPQYEAQTAYFNTTAKKFVWVDGQKTIPNVTECFCTVYNNGGHSNWQRVYLDPQIYSWMLSHHR